MDDSDGRKRKRAQVLYASRDHVRNLCAESAREVIQALARVSVVSMRRTIDTPSLVLHTSLPEGERIDYAPQAHIRKAVDSSRKNITVHKLGIFSIMSGIREKFPSGSIAWMFLIASSRNDPQEGYGAVLGNEAGPVYKLLGNPTVVNLSILTHGPDGLPLLRPGRKNGELNDDGSGVMFLETQGKSASLQFPAVTIAHPDFVRGCPGWDYSIFPSFLVQLGKGGPLQLFIAPQISCSSNNSRTDHLNKRIRRHDPCWGREDIGRDPDEYYWDDTTALSMFSASDIDESSSLVKHLQVHGHGMSTQQITSTIRGFETDTAYVNGVPVPRDPDVLVAAYTALYRNRNEQT